MIATNHNEYFVSTPKLCVLYWSQMQCLQPVGFMLCVIREVPET